MAIIKCKMCGGDLKVEEGSTVCECEYYGTKQTVPRADDEKKLMLSTVQTASSAAASLIKHP